MRKKKILCTLLLILSVIAIAVSGFKMKEYSDEMVRRREEMYQMSIEKMISGNLDAAERIISEECMGHPDVNVIRNACSALRYYDAGDYRKAYSVIEHTDYKYVTSITDEQRIWLTSKKSKIKTAKENYDKEERQKKEEREAQREKEKLQKLKESGIPYVGMSEDT